MITWGRSTVSSTSVGSALNAIQHKSSIYGICIYNRLRMGSPFCDGWIHNGLGIMKISPQMIVGPAR